MEALIKPTNAHRVPFPVGECCVQRQADESVKFALCRYSAGMKPARYGRRKAWTANAHTAGLRCRSYAGLFAGAAVLSILRSVA